MVKRSQGDQALSLFEETGNKGVRHGTQYIKLL